MGLKATRFATMEYIKSNVTAELRKIPKSSPPLVLPIKAESVGQTRASVCVGAYMRM
jgi:hypothetical protein